MSTIFTKILSGEIPCHRLAENDAYLSFLDVRPVARGHALVIPKKEIDRFFDMDDDLLGNILLFARPIVEAIESVVPCRRVGLMVAGLEVPHAHLHLIPINAVTDLSFANAAPADDGELADLAGQIRAALA